MNQVSPTPDLHFPHNLLNDGGNSFLERKESHPMFMNLFPSRKNLEFGEELSIPLSWLVFI